jgi:hypothetical protein
MPPEGKMKEKGMVGKTALLVCVALGIVLPAAAEELIRFAPKMFSDGAEYIEVSGTLSGDGIWYPNNTYVINCDNAAKECQATAVNADKNYISRVTGPERYPITSWTETEVVAQEDAISTHCSKTTIRIARKRQTVLWVQEPINQTQTWCTKSETRVLKFTIEDPAYWRAMKGR